MDAGATADSCVSTGLPYHARRSPERGEEKARCANALIVEDYHRSAPWASSRCYRQADGALVCREWPRHTLWRLEGERDVVQISGARFKDRDGGGVW